MELVRPGPEHLPSYTAALERGWSSDNVRGEAATREELARIAADPAGFLATMEDLDGTLPPITLLDGSKARRLPGFRRWMWDGELVGSIGFRWAPGTPELPPTCMGHIGYAVVPWKRGRGHATEALRLLLGEIGFTGLPYVELTAEPDNVASQRVIEANGGVLHERFTMPEAYGGRPALRYRIAL